MRWTQSKDPDAARPASQIRTFQAESYRPPNTVFSSGVTCAAGSVLIFTSSCPITTNKPSVALSSTYWLVSRFGVFTNGIAGAFAISPENCSVTPVFAIAFSTIGRNAA